MPFSTTQLRRMSGVSLVTILRWVSHGAVKQLRSGQQGPNNAGLFDTMAALGVIAGGAWLKMGGSKWQTADLVRFISSKSREHLLADFREGKTFPVPPIRIGNVDLPGTGGLVKPTGDKTSRDCMNRLNLSRLLEDLCQEDEETESRSQTKRPSKQKRR